MNTQRGTSGVSDKAPCLGVKFLKMIACPGVKFKKNNPGGSHYTFRVQVCDVHMGGFLGPKFSRQGSFSADFP